MGVEVSQHVRHGVKPQVVDVALPVLVHRQTQMLGERRKGKKERQDIRKFKIQRSEEGEIDGRREGKKRTQKDCVSDSERLKKADQDRGQDII